MMADTIARFRGFNPTAGEDIRELREELLGTCWSGAEKSTGEGEHVQRNCVEDDGDGIVGGDNLAMSYIDEETAVKEEISSQQRYQNRCKLKVPHVNLGTGYARRNVGE